MNVDLHNHTTRCNHAEGSTEAFVLKAIEQKIDYFGFSDHAPMDFDHKYRMGFEEMPSYENDILGLREMYKNEIQIALAYEVDFLEGYIDERVLARDVDYFIGSVHFIGTWGFDNPKFIGKYQDKNIDTIWQEYFDAIEAMAKSGLFQIAGHLDLIKVFNFLPTKDMRLLAKNAIIAIKKANMAVELNAAGLRKPIGEVYPSAALMELVSELEIPITFASDAHAPDQIGFKKDSVVEFARSFGYDKCAIFHKKERMMVKF